MRLLFKKYQKSSLDVIERDHGILTLPSGVELDHAGLRLTGHLQARDLEQCYDDFLYSSVRADGQHPTNLSGDVSIYEVKTLPG